MDGWNREMEREGRMLESIVALLVSFACLADRAACLPAAARLKLLAILALGEEEARWFVTGLVPGAPGEAAEPDFDADRPQRLAASFRALAWVLMALLAEARRLARAAGLALSSPVHGGSEGQARAAWWRGRDAVRDYAPAAARAPPSPPVGEGVGAADG
jgi:hypothetical protein